MPRVHTVKKANKDYPQHGIKKGDTYYWWKFRYSGKQMSKTYPKQSQLTQSSYLSQLYDLQDRIGNISAKTPEDLQSEVSDIISELESLRDECQSSLDNIPEQLQEGSAGSLLQERIDALENAISEFEGIDLDYDEPLGDDELQDEAKEELASEIQTEIDRLQEEDEELEDDDAENMAHENLKDQIDEVAERLAEEKLQEWFDEKINEIQSVSIE